MAIGNRISRHEALMLAVKEVAAANIRGYRPNSIELLVQEVEKDTKAEGFSAHWEWTFHVESYISIYFEHSGEDKKRIVWRPVVKVNWPAGARSPLEAKVSLQLYQLVTDLAARLEVMWGEYIVESAR